MISVLMMLFGLAVIAAAGALCGWWLEPGRAPRPRMRAQIKARPRGAVQRIVDEDAEADDINSCSRPAA